MVWHPVSGSHTFSIVHSFPSGMHDHPGGSGISQIPIASHRPSEKHSSKNALQAIPSSAMTVG
jgi:hypothetical protein